MRISDWSSDVCSSDLLPMLLGHPTSGALWLPSPTRRRTDQAASRSPYTKLSASPHSQRPVDGDMPYSQRAPFAATVRVSRSEERRVGKECVSTCRSGLSRYH